MAYDYDKLYGETPDALGPPTSAFVEFFDRLARPRCRVLDVGCGQGRDALFIARLGHSVVGVDVSPNGIRELDAIAVKENLAVEGIVADITSFEPPGAFDIILADRTLHMLKTHTRHSVLSTLLDHVNESGWLLIADEASNIAGFEAVISAHRWNWVTEFGRRGYLFIRRN